MPRKPLTDGEREQNERIEQNIADVGGLEGIGNLRSYQEFEDLFEDRDPFEFL